MRRPARSGLTLTLIAALAATLATTGCTRLTRMPTLASDSKSDNSSGPSADSSGDSADSSGKSADSTKGSDSNSESGDSKTESDSKDESQLLATATVTMAVVGGVIGIIFLTRLSDRRGTPGLDDAQQQAALDEARRYLRENRRQVRADISRGAGPFVDEIALAHTLPVPLRPRLGAAIQRAHAALDAPLSDAEVDEDETLRFAMALGDAMRSDPALAPHVEALAARLDADGLPPRATVR